MNQSLIPEPVRNRFNQGYKNLRGESFKNAENERKNKINQPL
jgi:hypothetical protein